MTLGDALLHLGEEQRHRGIVTRILQLRQSRTPPRATHDGYMTAEACAQTMGVTVDDVIRLAARGILEHEGTTRTTLLIRPAILTGLGLRDIRS